MSDIPEGYKKTVLGVIPIDWKLKKFEDVMTGFSSGATPYRGKPEYYKGEIRWITSGELNYNVITDTIEKITEIAVRDTNLKIHPKGTFLMAITGLEAEGTRGRCGIVGAEATTNQSCMALFPTKELLTEYLFHFYVNYGNSLALEYCQGTKQQSYTGEVAKILPIILPPTIEEQQAITSTLSDVDALITGLEALITKKRNIKQGAMQQLLTCKKRLPGFGEEWEVKTLGEVLKVRHGKSQQNIIDENGLYPILGTGGEIGRTSTYIYDKPSVLIGRKGTINVPQYMETPFWTIDTLFYTEISDNTNPKFIFYKFNLIDWYSYNEASGVPSMNASTIEKIEMSFPSKVNEQQAIATILSDMDAEIESLEQKRNKYKAIKQGMMQELLTGKTRLLCQQ